jgi:hypothetical protein
MMRQISQFGNARSAAWVMLEPILDDARPHRVAADAHDHGGLNVAVLAEQERPVDAEIALAKEHVPPNQPLAGAEVYGD